MDDNLLTKNNPLFANLKTLKLIAKKLKLADLFWMIGLIVLFIGLLLYFLTPIIVSSSFNITNTSDLTNNVLVNKQTLANALTYISYVLFAIAVLFTIIIGQSYSGIATLLTTKLINHQSISFNTNLRLYGILACFLLPFFFIGIFKKEVNNMVNYLNQKIKNEYEIIFNSKQWNDLDYEAKNDMLNLLLANQIIKENEVSFYLNKSPDYEENKSITKDNFDLKQENNLKENQKTIDSNQNTGLNEAEIEDNQNLYEIEIINEGQPVLKQEKQQLIEKDKITDINKLNKKTKTTANKKQTNKKQKSKKKAKN